MQSITTAFHYLILLRATMKQVIKEMRGQLRCMPECKKPVGSEGQRALWPSILSAMVTSQRWRSSLVYSWLLEFRDRFLLTRKVLLATLAIPSDLNIPYKEESCWFKPNSPFSTVSYSASGQPDASEKILLKWPSIYGSQERTHMAQSLSRVVLKPWLYQELPALISSTDHLQPCEQRREGV